MAHAAYVGGGVAPPTPEKRSALPVTNVFPKERQEGGLSPEEEAIVQAAVEAFEDLDISGIAAPEAATVEAKGAKITKEALFKTAAALSTLKISREYINVATWNVGKVSLEGMLSCESFSMLDAVFMTEVLKGSVKTLADEKKGIVVSQMEENTSNICSVIYIPNASKLLLKMDRWATFGACSKPATSWAQLTAVHVPLKDPEQAKKVMWELTLHSRLCKYPMIIAGDFNQTDPQIPGLTRDTCKENTTASNMYDWVLFKGFTEKSSQVIPVEPIGNAHFLKVVSLELNGEGIEMLSDKQT